jgi:hypothetical protein
MVEVALQVTAFGILRDGIEDNYDTKGLQTTAGSLALKGFAPTEDLIPPSLFEGP